MYILILWSLQGKFDIGANERQSVFQTIAVIGSRINKSPSLFDFLGEVKYWSGLDNVHIGTIRTILRLIWGIGLALSPPRFIKLTHSRMSVGYLEWPGVLFICVWRASACSPSRELCCLDGETGHRACTKNPFWYCHWHIQELRPNAEKLFPLKSCRLQLRLKCIFSHVVGVFHVVYCDDKKKKMQFWICHERHVFIATQIRLHSCYWVSQSLYSWLSILPLVIWPKT